MGEYQRVLRNIITKEKRAFALKLRLNMTEAEKVLWERFKGRKVANVRVRRQFPLYGYIVDFVCLKAKLVIEVDGGYHLAAGQIKYDAHRTSVLNLGGYEVVRFTNEDVINNEDMVIKEIEEKILKIFKERPPKPSRPRSKPKSVRLNLSTGK